MTLTALVEASAEPASSANSICVGVMRGAVLTSQLEQSNGRPPRCAVHNVSRRRDVIGQMVERGDVVTFVVDERRETVTCCYTASSKLLVCSTSDGRQQTHGAYGSGDAGQFSWPYVCYADDDGNVLIADCYNERLQVMNKQGEFSVLRLQPYVSQPRSAVLFKGHLYVTSFDKKTVSKYQVKP